MRQQAAQLYCRSSAFGVEVSAYEIDDDSQGLRTLTKHYPYAPFRMLPIVPGYSAAQARARSKNLGKNLDALHVTCLIICAAIQLSVAR